MIRFLNDWAEGFDWDGVHVAVMLTLIVIGRYVKSWEFGCEIGMFYIAACGLVGFGLAVAEFSRRYGLLGRKDGTDVH